MILEAFDSNWIAPAGPAIDQFETEFCERVELPHAVAVTSGTAALHLALRVCGVQAGDDVLVSTFTFIASATPIVYMGARPIFVDSERRTWNIDPAIVAEELDRRARAGRLPTAVIAVDLFGQPADYQPLVAACRQHGVTLIADSAEALGASYDDKPAGWYADLAVFSFNGNKIITTSGGGMLASRNQAYIDEARFLANQARDPAPHYEHSVLGYNYRISNILAALGVAQLRGLDRKVDRRRAINRRYREALAGVAGLDFAPVGPNGDPSYWLTTITLDAARFGATPEQLRIHLDEAGIECRPVWKPLHLQPAFTGCAVLGGAVAEDLFATGLCLPSGSGMTDDDVDRVTAAILDLTSRRTRASTSASG